MMPEGVEGARCSGGNGIQSAVRVGLPPKFGCRGADRCGVALRVVTTLLTLIVVLKGVKAYQIFAGNEGGERGGRRT